MQGFNKDTVKDPNREIFAEHPELKDELQNVLGNYKVDEISHEANKDNHDSKNNIIKENIDPQKSKEDDAKVDFNRYKKELTDSFNDFKQNIYKQIKLAKNSAYENIQKEKDKLEVTQKNLEDSLEQATEEYRSKIQAQREKLWDKDEVVNDPVKDKRKLVSEDDKEIARIKSLLEDGEMSEKMLQVIQNLPGVAPQSDTRLCDILGYHCPPETNSPTSAPTEMSEPSGGEGGGEGEENKDKEEQEEEDPRQKKLNAFKQKLYEKDKKLILSQAEKNQEKEKQYEDSLAYEKEKIAKAEAQKKAEDDKYLEDIKKQHEKEREQRIKDQDQELQELRQRNENALNEERVKLYGHWKPRNGDKVESVIEYKPDEAAPEATPEPTGQSTAFAFNPGSSEQSELNAKMQQEILQTSLRVTNPNGHIKIKKLN